MTRRLPPFTVRGDGPPLMVLSPYAVPASSLDALVESLRARFAVITFDYPGSGTAPLSPWPLTITGLAASAVDLLDHLGHQAATVVGVSMGGLVAQELALWHPERVSGLVLAATTPGGPHARWGSPCAQLDLLAVAGAGRFGRTRRAGALTQAMAATLHDSSRRLHHIQADTLVLHGAADRIVPVGNAHLLHAGIPASTLRVLPEHGHFFAFSDPGLSAGTILDWWGTSRRRVGVAAASTRALRPLAPLVPLVLGPPRAGLNNLHVSAASTARLGARLLGREQAVRA